MKQLDIFFEHISLKVELSPKEKRWIVDNANCIHYQKGKMLLKAGDTLDKVWFNTKGLLKFYYIDYEGKEKIKHFCPENNFALSICSLLKNEKSKFFIEALEDCEIIEFNVEKLRQELAKKEIWFSIMNEYLTESILEKENREADFLLLDSENRYKKFIKENRSLAERLKLYDVAAYLGIDPAHLSRIRKKSKN